MYRDSFSPGYPNFLSRFGRGLGLRFVRRLDEWRPGREGRQEVIKVKVFEGQNVMFRGVVVDRHLQHLERREGSQEGDAGGGGGGGSRLVKKTKSGTVMVATITPDKLVRFWTSGGDTIGCLDQVETEFKELQIVDEDPRADNWSDLPRDH